MADNKQTKDKKDNCLWHTTEKSTMNNHRWIRYPFKREDADKDTAVMCVA